MAKFNYLLSSNTSASNFTTNGIFDDTFVHSRKSAIDDFIEKRSALFALLRPYEENIDLVPRELMNMILLGCISAVESYVRKIIRTIIIVDESSRKICENQHLKYGAVITHDKFLLPEALLEEYSFTNGYNIKETIKKLTGIKLDNISTINTVFKEYSKICQLRHCVVHRFGLLGSNNAIELGLAEHGKFLEKPLQINFEHLNEMVLVCENLVKEVNNYLFCEVLERTYKSRTEQWYFDFRRDKKTFKKYYSLFVDSSCDNKEKVVYKEFTKSMQEYYGRNFV
ncbi:hypothetical protein [Paenibacillus taichungensis]